MDSGVQISVLLQHNISQQFLRIWNTSTERNNIRFCPITYFPYNQVAVRLVDVVVVKLFVLLVIVEPGLQISRFDRALPESLETTLKKMGEIPASIFRGEFLMLQPSDYGGPR